MTSHSDTSLIDEVMEAMHRALPSPRKDKWVPLSGFSRDYQRCFREQAERAIAAVRKWDRENAGV